MPAARDAEQARYINGVIVSEQHASILGMGLRIEKCKWVDKTMVQGGEKDKKLKASQVHAHAYLNGNTSAFNFEDGNSVVAPPLVAGTMGGQSAADSVLNPETGKPWVEGEKAEHLRAAVVHGDKQVTGEEEDSSIASGETAGWNSPENVVIEIEGMDEFGRNESKDQDVEMHDEEGEARAERNNLQEQLRSLLSRSGQGLPGEGALLGGDLNGLMWAAIEALQSKPPAIGNTEQNKPDEGNTGEDHRTRTSGGQGP